MKHQVALNDAGDFHDWMKERGWEGERNTAHRSDYQPSWNMRALDNLVDMNCGERKDLWAHRKTKKLGTILTFTFEDDMRDFVKRMG